MLGRHCSVRKRKIRKLVAGETEFKVKALLGEFANGMTLVICACAASMQCITIV